MRGESAWRWMKRPLGGYGWHRAVDGQRGSLLPVFFLLRLAGLQACTDRRVASGRVESLRRMGWTESGCWYVSAPRSVLADQ